MLIWLWVLVGIIFVALALAGYTVVLGRRRDELLGRTGVGARSAPARKSPLLNRKREERASVRQRIMAWLPATWREGTRTQDKLVRAGYDDPAAPLLYALVRLIVLVMLPIMGMVIASGESFPAIVLVVMSMMMLAWVLPIGLLDRMVRLRQERMRRSIPDALDLMLVCLEAGVSLDAAILRVSREMALVYPELSRELMIVNRKTNAGVTREDALRQLYVRTGVEELRALASSVIQSEKWGTSVAKVLRVSAETLRRRRRQSAEKKAALAPIKMTMPLVVLILPALFVVILGPVLMQMLGAVNSR